MTEPLFMSELVVAGAQKLFSQAQVQRALARMAGEINQRLPADEPVVVLGIMNGALVTLGELLTQLQFPLELDYVQATRYGLGETGGLLEWQRCPQVSLAGRLVLIVDDILDQGITLEAIVVYCRKAKTRAVYTAVLTRKQLPFAPAIEADFVALEVPDCYVFGYGMDYQGLWRNAPGIYSAPLADRSSAASD